VKEHILLLGSGGREHALARALRNSASCAELWCAPGNPGTSHIATNVDLPIADHAAVIEWCKANGITLVVVGPEQPLEAGIADALKSAGLDVFGPTASAARIESSKGFAKDFMARHGIPTARYRRFDSSERDAALAYVAAHPLPVVVKADGLAAGKGVVVATTTGEAEAAVQEMFGGTFGTSGASIVVESFLEGEEASLFAITDGERYVVLASAQDHKRIGDGDTGKNTGGMGSYAPAPLVTDDVLSWAEEHVIRKAIDGMRADGHPFVGCLYAGLMVKPDGTSSVVEFNCRFGDPETQTVMTIVDGDVAALFAGAARGALDATCIRNVADGCACTVVLASGGYPDAFDKGMVVSGLDEAAALDDVIVYHAGTREQDGSIVTSGGRVFGVTARGTTLSEARDRAYEAVDLIHYTNRYFRHDIAVKGINRSKEQE